MIDYYFIFKEFPKYDCVLYNSLLKSTFDARVKWEPRIVSENQGEGKDLKKSP